MNKLAVYDPLKNKTPVGVIEKNRSVKFTLKASFDCFPNEVYLMIKEDLDNDYKYVLMKRIKEDGDEFEVVENFNKSGHYFYCFKLNYNDFAKYLCKTFDNFSEILDYKGEDFVQIVTEEKYENTNSLQGGIIYQILPDRFCRKINSNEEIQIRRPLVLREDWGGAIKKNTSIPVRINEEIFGGNINGIISKLDYLKELNITAIYLNPIFQASSHHKYDTSDYNKIDDILGTEKDFQKLIKEAKKRNIKIIIDGVFNHTGSDSVYFNKNNRNNVVGAYNDKNSKYYDWFTFKSYPDDYECWWGIVTLPSIKKDSENYQEFIAGKNGVLDKYLKMGIDGVRLDVVDELSDKFVKKISDKILSYNKDNIIIGEVWEDASTKISYSERKKYFVNNELNSVMNYPLKNAIIDYIKTKEPYLLVSTLRMLINNYPKNVLDNLMNIVGTHDTWRIFSEIKNIVYNDNKVIKLLKIIYGILFTLPGVPTIYYGDEYGMENNDETSRGCFNWKNYKNEFYYWIKQLTEIRKENVLKNGEFNIIFAENGKFIFERFNNNEHLITLINLKNSELKIKLKGNFISFFNKQKIDELILKENEIEILIDKKQDKK